MPVYFVAQYVVNDAAKYGQYAKAAGPVIAANGGKVIAFDVAAKTVEGKAPGPQTVILEFENEAALNGWYRSDEYQAVIQGRLEATEGFAVVAQSMNAG